MVIAVAAATLASANSAGAAQSVFCGRQRATIVGTTGPDVLTGTPGNDVIAALGGDDIVHGKAGDDIICGGHGNDTLYGGNGVDRIFGFNGADRLEGGKGSDVLLGGFGRDILLGNNGQDTLKGGPGVDVLKGGAQRDSLRGGRHADQLDGGSELDTCYSPGDTLTNCERGGRTVEVDAGSPTLPTECPNTGRVIDTATIGWTNGQEVRDDLTQLLGTLDAGDTVHLRGLYQLAPGGVTIPDGVSITATPGSGFQLLDIAGGSGPWIRLGSCARWHNVTMVDTEARGPEAFVRTNNKTALYVDGEDVVISQAFFDTNTKVQLELRGVSDVRIHSTHFENGYYTVLIRPQTQDVQITDSRFSNSFGDGIKTIGGGASDVRRMLVSNSVFENNARDGIDTTAGWRNSLVEGTIFRGNGVSGMDIKNVYNTESDLHPAGAPNSNIRIVRSEFIDQPNGIVLTTNDKAQTLTEQSDALHLVNNIAVEDIIVERNSGGGRGLLIKDAHTVSWDGVQLLGGATLQRTFNPEENRTFGGVPLRPPIPTSNFNIGGQNVTTGPARGPNNDYPFGQVGPR